MEVCLLDETLGHHWRDRKHGGNAQNVNGLIQYGSEADDFEFDEVGSSIEMSPTNTPTCDQQVNQAATASG